MRMAGGKVAVLVALLGMGFPARAGERVRTPQGPYERYFPLAVGNRWFVGSGAEAQAIAVTQADGEGGFLLRGFPTRDRGIWVRFRGGALCVRAANGKRWNPLLRFPIPEGGSYPLHPGTYAAQGTTATVIARGETFMAGAQTYTNCIRIRFASASGGDDWIFAPGVGPVGRGRSDGSGGGARFLAAAELDGAPVGAIPFTTLETGWQSAYPWAGQNLIWVVHNDAEWAAFYARHRPGVPPPPVDFTTHTVLAAISAVQPCEGFMLGIEQVRWTTPPLALPGGDRDRPGGGTGVPVGELAMADAALPDRRP